MSAILGNGTVTFGDGTSQNTSAYNDLYAIKSLDSPVNFGVAFSNGQSYDYRMSYPQYNRYTTYYVTRCFYQLVSLLDNYGNPYTWPGLAYPGGYSNQSGAYDTVSYANTSTTKSVKVKITATSVNPGVPFLGGYYPTAGAQTFWAGAQRTTDDYDYHIIYRGGSPASPTSHSGGTQIVNGISGQVCYDTIPANTTYTYWHYATLNGSNVDTLFTTFNVSFVSFV